MRLKLVQETKSITCEKSVRPVYILPRLENQNWEDVTSRLLDRVQGATKKNTSENLVLQRYAEIVPSVNRTAVIVYRKPLRAECVTSLRPWPATTPSMRMWVPTSS